MRRSPLFWKPGFGSSLKEASMTYRTILVELAGDVGIEPRLQLARRLADRFDAVLIGLHVMPAPFIPASYGEAAAYLGPELIEAQRQANREATDQVKVVFHRVCGGGPDALWQEAEGDRGDLLARAARTSDLVLARRAKPESTEVPDVLDQLVTAAGVPVLALPPGGAGEPGQIVLVAWNGSREAARAAHDALPFLQAAKRVVLCAIGAEAARSLEAAATMLRRHGIAVEPRRVDEPDGGAGEILLAQAQAEKADLLVMGAYGHARLREWVFGGATRHVLSEATLPVLFSG
jgi:nucleotide-binding universal stress UspA family protein